jgi:acyl-CoA thioester hydrolase
VRYPETDPMGVVYHAHYLNWFEMGRNEMIRSIGVSYRSLEERNLLLPVLEANVEYKKPARFDDVLAIYTRIVGFTGLRMEFASEVRRLSDGKGDLASGAVEVPGDPEGELLVLGKTRHAWLNRNWKPVLLHKEAPDVFAVLEHCRDRWNGGGEG